MTLTGHSLGAGVTSLLAALLKEKGLKRLKCYAFEPPACMDRSLADWVSGGAPLPPFLLTFCLRG